MYKDAYWPYSYSCMFSRVLLYLYIYGGIKVKVIRSLNLLFL